MNPSAWLAARLSEVDRKDLAAQALAGTTTVTDLSGQHGVSRKFVYQQASKAIAALDEVFASSAPDDAVLIYLPVTKVWLRRWCTSNQKTTVPQPMHDHAAIF